MEVAITVSCTYLRKICWGSSDQLKTAHFDPDERFFKNGISASKGLKERIRHLGLTAYQAPPCQTFYQQVVTKFSWQTNRPKEVPEKEDVKRIENFAPILNGKKGTDILKYVRDGVIGKEATFNGPFGIRKVIYCDYTASGKPLTFIEDYIRDKVYPFYANTHTTTSYCAKQTSHLREESRKLIKECVNASEDDVVIFTGSGTTAAVHKLIHCMQLHLPIKAKNTVVLVGPFEHHSNILPWKETGAKVIRIRETRGHVDLNYLEQTLQDVLFEDTGVEIIASLSAASNVSGILTDTDAVTELVHQYGGLSFWDYASAAPYIKLDMNPNPKARKDAVFCSPHKFVGGPGTPGVLIAKKSLFRNAVPDGCGGGTVLYVTRDTHVYIKDIEEREEGGTPAIIESVRAALCFQLKRGIGTNLIEKIEEQMCKKAFKKWKQNPNLRILGAHGVRRLTIFSLLIFHQDSGKLLHHNFVATLLNDLYGIQARGGCACAGPYAQELLGLDEEMAQKFVWFLTADTKEDGDFVREPLELMKPGFCRLNLPFFFDDDTVDYILEAVDAIATHGWKLLPLYKYNCRTGEWTHRDHETRLAFHLNNVTYVRGRLSAKVKRKQEIALERSISARVHLRDVLDSAQDVYRQASQLDAGIDSVDFAKDESIHVTDEQRKLIWFLQPKEAFLYLTTPSLKFLPHEHAMPFTPKSDGVRKLWRKIATQASPLTRRKLGFNSRGDIDIAGVDDQQHTDSNRKGHNTIIEIDSHTGQDIIRTQ